MSTSTLPRTAAKSTQLLAASRRTTHDPMTEIDWDVPIADDSAFHLPPELLPLHGTRVWDAMSEPERITYSRYELSAMLGAGIWFENALMRAVLRHLIDIPVTDPIHQYLLTEVADECRHSTLFGEWIKRSDTPVYGPDLFLELGNDASQRALSYLLILAIEELLDFANRATMKDERVHPTSRHLAKIHVLEEARHVSFAKSYLGEAFPTMSDDDREAVRDAAATLTGEVVRLSIDERVYADLGIADGLALVHANPAYRATVVAGLAKLTGFLTEIGIIDDTTRADWLDRGLVA